MKKILEGKVAVVTGSGQGIGRDIARCFAACGASVITNNRKKGSALNSFEKTEIAFNEEETRELEKMSGDAETTAREIIASGGSAIPFFGDVSKSAVAKEMIQTAVDNYGRIDIIVHNASSNREGSLMDMNEELWDVCINSKLKGAFNLMHYALPIMKEQGYGRILNSSSDAFQGVRGLAAYGAANAGVNTLTKAAAKELAGTGITANAYTPLAKTRAWYNQAANYRLRGIPTSILEKQVPEAMKHSAEGMVPFLAYLASEEGKDISGYLFKLAADGEIGVWSEPEIDREIKTDNGIWEIDELRRRVPGELLG